MTPIERMQSHLDLAVEYRNQTIVERRQHNPMVVSIGVKGNPMHPGTTGDLKDELYASLKRLSKMGLKLSRGEVEENTAKKAAAEFLTLLRNIKRTCERMAAAQESVEHWEGAVQMGQIAVDVLELEAARMRRAS